MLLDRAGLSVTEEDIPALWEQFEQARANAEALERWQERTHDLEPVTVFVPPGAGL